MKTRFLFGMLALAGCALCTTGCGDDEEMDLFPEGTSTLHMMNEENGKTLLGNSDVYITNEWNFKSDQFPLFDMGRKQGIGDIDLPNFVNMAPEVAVQPGHGYVVCSARDVKEFYDSGQKAIAANADIYRVYVDSWIQDKDKVNTGAKVHFLLGKADFNESLPAWDTCIGTLWWDYDKGDSESVTLTVPAAAAGDLEVVPLDEEGWDDYITSSISKNTITFKLKQPWRYNTMEFSILIRNKHVYTRATVQAMQAE